MLKRVSMICVLLFLAVPALANLGSIHTMIAGDQAVDLTDVVQITTSMDGDVDDAWISPDGNYIVYSIEAVDKEASIREKQLRLLRLPDGKSSVLLDSSPISTKAHDAAPQEMWEAGSVWWAPNSKAIVFRVDHMISQGAEAIQESSLVVMSTSGTRKATFTLSKDSWVTSEAWNPDGTKFVAGVMVSVSPGKFEPKLEIFDFNTNTVQDLVTLPDGFLRVYRWGGDGQHIEYTYHARDASNQLKEITVDGKSDKVIIDKYHGEKFSPNGKLKLLKSEPTISVLDMYAGKTIELGVSSVGGFIDWTPKSNLLTYYTEQTISAGDKVRRKKERLIWLAQVSNTKTNHMCVAIDADQRPDPSWSNDCTEMAYTSGHRLYVARLSSRTPDVVEKLAAGVPLTQQEQDELKDRVYSNGKQLGLAALMYSSDYDENLPSPDTSLDTLIPYISEDAREILAFPGVGGKPFEQLLAGSLKDIENPAETPMFIIDAGYNWKIVVYADGHTKIEPKK